MTWVESVSPSFRARHEAADADDADRILYSLEHTRERLERTRELPFEGTPVLSDDEFERASEEIASIASDRQPVLV
jgi:hypothetical protein